MRIDPVLEGWSFLALNRYLLRLWTMVIQSQPEGRPALTTYPITRDLEEEEMSDENA
jgi:hypothetical protein